MKDTSVELNIMREMELVSGSPATQLVQVGLIAPDMEVRSEPYQIDEEADTVETEKEDERWEDDGGVTILDGSDTIKDYQSFENGRNKASAQLFADLITAAYGDRASNVLIAHHLNFEHGSDIGTVNEIPSADTLIFDHEIMVRVFGKDLALKHMALLATVPVDRRDGVLEVLFRERKLR